MDTSGWVWKNYQSIYLIHPLRLPWNASKRRFLFNTALRSLALSECLDAVVGDGTNVVLLIPEGNVNIDRALSTSARMLGMNAEGVAENTGG